MRRFTPALYVIALLFAACGGETDSTAGGQAPTGQVGGVCYGNGSCNEGLVCTSGYCIPEGPESDVLLPDAQNDVEAPGPDVQAVVDTAGPDVQEVVDTAGPDVQEVVDTAGPDAQEVVDTAGPDVQVVVDTAGPDVQEVVDTAGPDVQEIVDTTGPESGCPALFFDGVDDYVTAASTIEYGSEFTVELWTKFESAPHTWNYLFMHDGVGWPGDPAGGLLNGGVRIMVSQIMVANQLVPEAKIFFHIGTASGVSAPVLPNSWSHVALVYANGTATGYLDGAEIVTFSASSPGASASGGSVHIGGEAPLDPGEVPSGWNWELNKYYAYHGSIRHVRISSVPRYMAPFNPSSGLTADADTVALWPLDDGEGTTATDSGSQGFDAAIVGAMWVGVDGLECTQE